MKTVLFLVFFYFPHNVYSQSYVDTIIGYLNLEKSFSHGGDGEECTESTEKII